MIDRFIMAFASFIFGFTLAFILAPAFGLIAAADFIVLSLAFGVIASTVVTLLASIDKKN